jgi:hypothetical protein
VDAMSLLRKTKPRPFRRLPRHRGRRSALLQVLGRVHERDDSGGARRPDSNTLAIEEPILIRSVEFMDKKLGNMATRVSPDCTAVPVLLVYRESGDAVSIHARFAASASWPRYSFPAENW